MRQESRFLHGHHPNPQGFVVKSCHLKSCAVRPCHLEDMLWVVQGTQGHDDTGERKGPMTKRPESFLKCWRTESLSPKPLALSFHVFRGGKLMKLIRCWFAKLVGRLRSLRGWAFTHGPLPPRAPSKRPTPSTCMCSKLGAFSSQFTGTGQHMHKPSSKSVRISAFPTNNKSPVQPTDFTNPPATRNTHPPVPLGQTRCPLPRPLVSMHEACAWTTQFLSTFRPQVKPSFSRLADLSQQLGRCGPKLAMRMHL